jgi:magnesium transporter
MRIVRSVDVQELRELRETGEFFWLDVEDPSGTVVAQLGEVLGLHPLATEDTQEFDQRPKLDRYDDELLLVYYGAGEDEQRLPAPVEVHLHVTSQFVLTVHRSPCLQFTQMQDRLTRRPPGNASELVYRVIDALTDSLLDVLERVDSEVEDAEAQVFRRPRARDRDRMAMLRRSLGGLRRLVVMQKQVFDRWFGAPSGLPVFDPALATYYRDVGDHLWRVMSEVEAARESLQGIMDTYTNEVQERLTIVATIFLPLTVITGFFGQNFTWLINHIGSAAAFWGLGVGGLIVSMATIVLWLVRSGLYHGGEWPRPRAGRTGQPISRRRPKTRSKASLSP